jgi:hypothetical protein
MILSLVPKRAISPNLGLKRRSIRGPVPNPMPNLRPVPKPAAKLSLAPKQEPSPARSPGSLSN